MAKQTLAVKYRPQTWQDMSGQESIKSILSQQLKEKSFKNAYLFCGSSGCGKTTSARIFATEINQNHNGIIEIDGASNNGVDNIRSINEQSKKKSLESDYKIFIIDECHVLSSSSWQAFLKTLEDCPKYTIFIFCTTNPEKIPNTVLNRVQRYDFNKIPLTEIKQRLNYICEQENIRIDSESIDYISKLADGGMRDGISMLDKVSSLTNDITLQDTISAIGTVDYDIFFELYFSISLKNNKGVVCCIENVNNQGKDMVLFFKHFQMFLLDVCKYCIFEHLEYIKIPATNEYVNMLRDIQNNDNQELTRDIDCYKILDFIIELNNILKKDNHAYVVESLIINFINKGCESIE